MKKFDLVFEELFQGIAKGKTLEDLAKKHDTDIKTLQHQLDKGMKVEMEHTKDKVWIICMKFQTIMIS